MSLVFMTFMLVPVLAPLVGQGILLVAPWRAIFIVLAGYAAAMLAWSWLRLPETLHPEFRRTLHWRAMAGAMLETLRERQSLGYTLAMTVTFAGLVAYISSIQQIVFEVFDAPQMIGVVFAAIAAPMALASYGNSRIVGRFGLRRVGHISALLLALVTIAHVAIALTGHETLLAFVVMQGLTMFCFAFTSSNFGTLAMEHMAPIAGTASSVQGVINTLGSAVIGFAIGQSFDGTALPYLFGIATCSTLGFIIVALTEPRKLFARLGGKKAMAQDLPCPRTCAETQECGAREDTAPWETINRSAASVRGERRPRRARRGRPSAFRRLPRSFRGWHFRSAWRHRDCP